MPTVLVVEDEASFVEALTIGLQPRGLRVEVARDGFEALERFDIVRPDLVLLDVMLPRVSGIDVCRAAAQAQPGPDHHGHGQGRRDRHRRRPRGRRRRLRHQAVPAARAGGPDARRAAPAARRLAPASSGPTPIDGRRRRARPRRAHRDASAASRSRCRSRSSSCSHVLLANAGRVLPRETLIDRVWGSDYVGDTKTLDVHIKRLRRKIEPDPSQPDAHRHDPRPRLQVRAHVAPAPRPQSGRHPSPGGDRPVSGSQSRPDTNPAQIQAEIDRLRRRSRSVRSPG